MRNAAVTETAPYRLACRADEVKPGSATVVRVGEREVALFHVEGRIHALDNRCPHAGGPLAEGTVIGSTVICSWHCAAFDLETGESLDSISRWDADAYAVRVEDGKVWVRIEDEEEE